MTKDEIITQNPEETRLRKYRISLLCTGNAMILFAVWTVIRTIFQINQLGTADTMGMTFQISLAVILILDGIDLVLKLYLGFSARAEGLGKKRKRYIVLGVLLAAVSAYALVVWILQIPYFYSELGFINLLVSLIVEATALYAILTLVTSAVRVRKLENSLAENQIRED